MMKRARWALVIGWLGVGLPAAMAQTGTAVIRLTYPESRAVFQRDNDNSSTIFVSGSCYQPVDSVQARLIAEVTGQGLNTDWQTVQRNPQGGVFQGAVRGTLGWYRLEVRAYVGREIVGQDVVRKVGIGEVFMITGQSNAQGFQDFGATGASDDRVNCITYDNYSASSLADPPAPTFQQLSSAALIGPRGQSAWCWGILGDLIARQYNCPVLFINTAWAGTSIRNWVESANNVPTKNIFRIGQPDELYPPGMPYANLVIAIRYYCSLQGLRAILWQQGETDNVPLQIQQTEYQNLLQFLVNKTRADTRRYPSWILARSSLTKGFDNRPSTSQAILNAQTVVINTYNNNVYPGPFTDNLQSPRPDGTHFSGDGLRILAQAWYQSMDPLFFSRSLPLLPLAQPSVSVACGPNGANLTLTLPSDGYKSFSWRTQPVSTTAVSTTLGNGPALTVTQAGTYRATLKDEFGNTFLSPAVEVITPIQPAVPTVSTNRQPGAQATSEQQVCADSVLTLMGNAPSTSRLIWNTGSSSRTLAVATANTYAVQAVNAYGCRSTQSTPITLMVRPRLSIPTVQPAGTYSIQAILPGNAYQNTLFDWRRGLESIKQDFQTAKTVSSGVYSVRSKELFTLNSGSITCYSGFSAPYPYILATTEQGMSVYPNPLRVGGSIFVETIEDLPNAEVSVYTLTGQIVYQDVLPVFNHRKQIMLTGMPRGQYIVRVRSAGYNVARRIVVD